MNRYFSRLAQRSGVNTNALVARPGNPSSHGESGWGEQTVETVATGAEAISTPRNGNSEITSGAFDNPSAIHSSPERVITSAPLVAASLEPRASAPIQHKADDSFIAGSTVLPTPLDTSSGFLPPRQSSALNISETAISKNNSATENEISITKTVSESAKQDLVYSKRNDSRVDAQARASNQAIEPVAAFSDAPIESIVHPASAKARGTKYETSQSHQDSGTTARESVRAEVRPSGRGTAGAGKFETVTSSPVQKMASPIPQTRTTSNSSIEVNIGKIELEIITPAKKTVSAPAAAPAKVQRSKPAAVFNPHRHYLRGR